MSWKTGTMFQPTSWATCINVPISFLDEFIYSLFLRGGECKHFLIFQYFLWNKTFMFGNVCKIQCTADASYQGWNRFRVLPWLSVISWVLPFHDESFEKSPYIFRYWKLSRNFRGSLVVCSMLVFVIFNMPRRKVFIILKSQLDYSIFCIITRHQCI